MRLDAIESAPDDPVYARRFKRAFMPGKASWNAPVNIVMPRATQNEVTLRGAIQLLENGMRYYVACPNMAATDGAIRVLRTAPDILVAGTKAAGCGGAVASAPEMSQNLRRTRFTKRDADQQLRRIMSRIYDDSSAAAQCYGLGHDLTAGSNIAAFRQIAVAMLAQGDLNRLFTIRKNAKK